MFRKFLIKLLVKLYLKQNREVHKLTPEEETKYLLFKTQLDVERLLRAYLTGQTLRYWEAKSDEERWVVRGSSLAYQNLLDLHRKALEIENHKREVNKKK